jgi:hypothetical protein
MDKVLELGKYLLANWEAILMALNGLVAALIAVALLIPGDQPEKSLRAVADFLARFSRKPQVKAEDKK